MGAYKFDGVDDEAIYTGTSPVTDYPYTIGVVTMAEDTLAVGDPAGLYNSTDDTRYAILQYLAANDFAHRVASGGSGNSAISANTGADDTWETGVGVGTSATSRAAYRDGANKGTTATSRAFPTGLDRIVVGRFNANGVTGEPFDGWVAYVFIWDVALSDAEVADFHAGTLPQEASLVAAYDFTTDQGSTIADLIGTRDLTVTGAVYDGAVTPAPTFSLGGGTQTLALGHRAGAATVRGSSVEASGAATVGVGRKASAATLRGIGPAGAGTATLTLGQRAGAATLRGITAQGAGSATLALGHRASGSTLRGVSVTTGTGTQTLALGHRAGAAVVRGSSPSATGSATLSLGRRAGAATLRGSTITASGVATLGVGRRASALVLYGVTVEEVEPSVLGTVALTERGPSASLAEALTGTVSMEAVPTASCTLTQEPR